MIVCETDKHVELPEEIGQVGIWKEKSMEFISKVTAYADRTGLFTGSLGPITIKHALIERAAMLV